MEHDRPPPGRLNYVGIFLPLLLAADAVFVVVHLVHVLTPYLSDWRFSIESDGAFAEVFQYVKEYWIILTLATLWWRTRAFVIVPWVLLFAYLLCDDALRIHERGGEIVAGQLGLVRAFGLRAVDLGELVVSCVAGVPLLGSIAAAYYRATPNGKNLSRDLALLLAVLVFFGVGVDMLHIVVKGKLKVPFGLLEDGGEMLTMSVMCWYALNLLERRGEVPTTLWRLVRPARPRDRSSPAKQIL